MHGSIPPRSPPLPVGNCWPSTPRLRNSRRLLFESYCQPCFYPQRPAHPAAAYLSSIDLIRCSNKLLVSCSLPRSLRGLPRSLRSLPIPLARLARAWSGVSRTLRRRRRSACAWLCLSRASRGASKGSRRFIQLRILGRSRLPRKIFRHPVQLDALPDPFIHVMMQRLPNRKQQRLTGILAELESSARAVLQIELLDAVVQSAAASHALHPTILHTVHLIQPRRLVARRHQEHMGAGLDLVRQRVVIRDLYAYATRISRRQRAEQIFILALTRSQYHQHQVFAHQFVRPLCNKIEALLIRKARHDSDQRPLQVIV